MKKTKLKMLAIALFVIASVNVMYATIVSPSNLVPTPNSQYVSTGQATFVNGGNTYVLDAPCHGDFTGAPTPLPSPGQTQFYNFGSTLKGTLHINGGPSMMINASGPVMARATSNGTTGTYQTEMLAMNLSGGNLPAGVMIRESPTLQSTGQHSVSPNGANYTIDSFFDVFIELSTDGGQTWSPASNPFHLEIQPSTNGWIPTLSQWGLIIFGLLFLAVTMVFVYKRKSQLSI